MHALRDPAPPISIGMHRHTLNEALWLACLSLPEFLFLLVHPLRVWEVRADPLPGQGLGARQEKVSMGMEGSMQGLEPLSPLPEGPRCLMYHQTQPLLQSTSSCLFANPVFTVLVCGLWAELGQQWDGGKRPQNRGPPS